MKPATKLLILFSLLFCLATSEKSDQPQNFVTSEKSDQPQNFVTSEKSDQPQNSSAIELDDYEDYRRLIYLANCRIVVLGPGEFKLRADGTLEVDAFNLILNKTFYDTDNDTAIICKPFYPPDWSFRNVVFFPVFITMFVMIFCLTLFAIQDYEQLYWLPYVMVFFIYLLSVIGEFIRRCTMRVTEYSMDQSMHFMGLQFFFWMSSLASDAMLLSVGGKVITRLASSSYRLLVIHAFYKLTIVIAILGCVNITEVAWPLAFSRDSVHNFLLTVSSFFVISLYNIVVMVLFFYKKTLNDQQRRLLDIFWLNFFLGLFIVGFWFVEYLFLLQGPREKLSLVFQLETACGFVIVIAGAWQFRNRKYDVGLFVKKPLAIKNVALKFNNVPSDEEKLPLP